MSGKHYRNYKLALQFTLFYPLALSNNNDNNDNIMIIMLYSAHTEVYNNNK